MKTLVIGARPGNILWEWVTIHSQGPKCRRAVCHPGQEELDVQNVEQMMAYIKKQGPFDELIYGAAINHLEWTKDIIRTNFIRHTFHVNVIGFVEMVSAHMFYHGVAPKRIVGITSDAARVAMRGSLSYGASKAAMSHAIKNMARELSPESVVVGVAPGMVDDTPMSRYVDATVPAHRGWTPEYARQYEESMIPMGRRITKKEVVQTIHFALEGPDMLAGSILEITGGK